MRSAVPVPLALLVLVPGLGFVPGLGVARAPSGWRQAPGRLPRPARPRSAAPAPHGGRRDGRVTESPRGFAWTRLARKPSGELHGFCGYDDASAACVPTAERAGSWVLGSTWPYLVLVGLVSIQSLSSSETRSMPIRPARSSRSRKMHSPLPSARSAALCSSDGATPSSDMTLATSPRSEDRNANTLDRQFVTCSFSRSPAFWETRISAVFLDRPILDTSGTSLAPSGVDVIAHASSRKMALGEVLSIPFRSLRAN